MAENTFTPTGIVNVSFVREPLRTVGDRLRPPRPPSGQVTLWADGEPSVTALLMAQPEGDGGVGGYEEIARPGAKPVSVFNGTTLRTMSLTLRLERGVTTNDVEGEIEQLYRLGQPEAPGAVPGGVWVIGEVPFKTTDLLRIDNIARGPRSYMPGSRLKLRYHTFTVSFTELVLASVVEKATPRRTRALNGKRRVRVIRSRQGDTMRLLAVAELGSATRWRDLRAWNPKLVKADPDALLRVGTKVTIK